MSERVPVSTVERTFEIAQAIDELSGASFSELVEHLELPKSTLHDHLSSLEAMGYVVRAGDEYEIGTRFLELGNRARHRKRIFRIAQPEVEKLAEETGEHASLTIEEQGEGVLLYVARGRDAVKLGATAGEHLPLSVTAPGKAILAQLPDAEVERIVDAIGVPERTAASITDRAELFDELEAVRERGYATEMGEAVQGVRALAVPIVSGGGVVQGAITVGGPANRMTGERFDEELPTLLMRAANVVEVNFSQSP
jgi:DNA-binding IclR family transcriptional regulator